VTGSDDSRINQGTVRSHPFHAFGAPVGDVSIAEVIHEGGI
jgi:hypothetical protein